MPKRQNKPQEPIGFLYMEDAVTEELKLGVLMKDDVRRELDLLHQMSTSLLVFDMKRKQLDSHFDSLVNSIERQRDEAMKAIRAMEEEAEVAAEKRRKELRLREERLRVKIENEKKEVERLAAECVVKEKEMREAKMAAEIMSVELCGKEKEVNVMKKAVDDLTARVHVENARFNDTCQRLSDENLALRNEVKLLTQQLELKAQPLGREEQISEIYKFLHLLTSAGIITICNTMQHAELNGKVLFMHVREHIDDHEVATAKVSSVLLNVGDKAEDLILEALGISYSTELEEQGSQSIIRPCRILLLEQLCQICPQTKSQAREEALKVAVEWRAGVESCADKYSEISRFVRFLSMYDIASEFKDEVLLPMLHNVAVHEGTPDLCFTLGFADRITGYIKTLLKSSQLLKALEYVSAFKLARQFSVRKIVQEQMNQLKQTCQSMLKEGGHSQAAETQILDFQINTLKELIKCIKDLEVHGKYSAMNLEVRLVKLKRRKYIKKRPAPSPDPSSDPEPVKKKGCKPTGAAKSIEVEPKDTSNVYPESGSRDLCSSNLSSDSEPLNKKCFELPVTARSKGVPKDTLSVNPESGSKDCCSNSSSNAEPLKNQTSELPETFTTKSNEVDPKDSLNVYQESESKDLCLSNPSIDPEPLRKKGCKPSGTCKLTEGAPKDTLNANPESGSRDLCRPSSSSNPKPLKKKGCKLLVLGTAKSNGAPRHDLNAHREIGSRNALHSQDMQKAPYLFHPPQFRHDIIPSVSPYICPPPEPSQYKPPEFHYGVNVTANSHYIFPPPGPSQYELSEFLNPPQYYHPCPTVGGYPEVPFWHYPMSEGPPYFDYWH
ncbi:hypothetical protein QQ045_001838 [Rhodiola kirilowii]